MSWGEPADAAQPSDAAGAVPPPYPAGGPVPYELARSALPAPVEDPAPYHRLFRTGPRYAWWRPLVAVALFGVFFLVASVIVAVIWFIIAFATDDVDFTTVSDQNALLAHLSDTSNPLSLGYLLVSVAIMLPCVPLAMLCAGLRPVGLRHSVTFRLRWGWMLWCAIPALAITVANVGLSFVPLAFGETLEPVPVDAGVFVASVVIILLLVPLQSAAEEYVFRGLIMQTLGAWVRPVWIGIVLSTIIFTVGHTQYELWGMLSVAVMGAGFAIVTWRTGGLEAAIALHVVNNVISFLLLASGVLGTTVMSSEGSTVLAPLIQLVFTVGYLAWVEWGARRRGIARVRELASGAPA
ncbi:CPBP family intramembrane metalloprotease [Protaetiibacter sp. SSC-01]|uniref:CPBP family intramembrane glutamic endopeptidase n=1 Tax=Protaetiibacter sp. SSC-01 TaxID=2759943 RepID=UPI00165755B5|nr:CPBP family intramembrane glutamic endopeptidase [Protaetiibacter sp. SSC-01]QNO38629.1 CPBP family intramembrane metalloprotease [Protaetiibacter sp. SSC-01]